MLIGVSDHCALSARDDDLSIAVDNAADSLAQNELFLAMLEPFKLLNVFDILRGRVDSTDCAIGGT